MGRKILFGALTALGSLASAVVTLLIAGALSRGGASKFLPGWGALVGLWFGLFALSFAIAGLVRWSLRKQAYGFGAAAAIVASLVPVLGGSSVFQRRAMVEGATSGESIDKLAKAYILFVGQTEARVAAIASPLIWILPFALGALVIALAWRQRRLAGTPAAGPAVCLVLSTVISLAGAGLCVAGWLAPIQDEKTAVGPWLQETRGALSSKRPLSEVFACDRLGNAVRDLGEETVTRYFPEWQPAARECVDAYVKGHRDKTRPQCSESSMQYDGIFELGKRFGREAEMKAACEANRR